MKKVLPQFLDHSGGTSRDLLPCLGMATLTVCPNILTDAPDLVYTSLPIKEQGILGRIGKSG